MSLRLRMEGGFERWADFVVRWRRVVAAACIALVGGLSLGLPGLTIETSFESYLPHDNPARRLYEHFRREFGSDERIVVLLEPQDLYDPVFLEELRALHQALADGLPYLDDITSLVNARYLVSTPDSLRSEDLLAELPRSAAELATLRARIRASPWYRNVLVSEDEAATAIVIEIDAAVGPPAGASGRAGSEVDEIRDALEGFDGASTEPPRPRGALLDTAQSERLVRALDAILQEHAPTRATLRVAGTPLLAHRLGSMLNRDILIFVSLSLVLTASLLFLLFRSFWATLNPLLVVGLAVLGTLGWMGWTGVPISAVTEIVPSLLVAVGVADSVHIQAMFLKEREQGREVHAAIREAMGHSGLAVLLTSVTTAASMAAFQSAELQPVIDLGHVAPVGVALAFLFSIALLPALMSSTPMGAMARGEGTARRIDGWLLALGRLGTRHPRGVLAGVGGLAAVAAVGAATLGFSQDDLRWLPEDDPLRVATERLNESMSGAEPLELLLESAPGLDLREPEVLRAIERIERRAEALRVGDLRVGQSLSLVDVVQETHRALGVDPGAELSLPDSREAVSQELLLFETADPDALARLVDSAYRTTRVSLTVPFADALNYPRFSDALGAAAGEVLHEEGLAERLRLRATGLMMIAGETFELLFVSMALSYAIAFGVIAVLMLSLIGEPRLGLLSMVPNVVPILLVLGSMGWMGSPLDVSSMLVGGILIGVVVDDTIHFAHNFARYRGELGCSLEAVRRTLLTSGRAMLVTSVVLSIGFFSFSAAYLRNVVTFGLLCGTGVVLAFLADVIVMPALVARWAPCAADCPAHGEGPPERRAEPA